MNPIIYVVEEYQAPYWNVVGWETKLQKALDQLASYPTARIVLYKRDTELQ